VLIERKPKQKDISMIFIGYSYLANQSFCGGKFVVEKVLTTHPYIFLFVFYTKYGFENLQVTDTVQLEFL
jgi:hypothetical protein